MPFEVQLAERRENLRPCGDCGRLFPHVTGWASNHSVTAAYFASPHTDEPRQAAVDVLLGSWQETTTRRWFQRRAAGDAVLFSCLLRPGSAMAVDAPRTLCLDDAEPVLGRLLTRDEALAHPWLPVFWEVVDAIAVQDPVISATVGSA